MIYGVCLKCGHTKELEPEWVGARNTVTTYCYSCGAWHRFRIVRLIEQPDGSVVEVTA